MFIQQNLLLPRQTRRYILLQINPTRCTVLLSIFISLLHMFRANMCPSLGEIAVSIRHWYLSLCMDDVWSVGCSFTPTSRLNTTHTEWQIPVLHINSNFSWRWAHGCPKHVEKINKHIKQNCAPSWIYLQDFQRMHCQQNIKYIVSVFSEQIEFYCSSTSPNLTSIVTDGEFLNRHQNFSQYLFNKWA